MKIGIVTEFFYPTLGGIQEHVYFFARELLKRGHQPKIITPQIPVSGDIEKWWPEDLPREIYCPIGISLPFFINGSVGRTCVGFRMGSKLKNLLTPENFDIVHIHSPMLGVLALLSNHFATAPVVGTFHTSFGDSLNLRFYKFLLRRHLRRLNSTICVSPISRASIQNIFSDFDAHIIPNGIDTNIFRPLDLRDDDRFQKFVDGKLNILFMGRADPRNGLGTLIKAFHEAKKVIPEMRLLVAGGGDLMSTYQSMVADLSTSDVEFLGPVRDERPQLYRTADIQFFGVERAAFALTLLEGMATALPIITTDFEGHEFTGRAGEHFVTSPFGNVPLLVERLVELAQDPKKRREIGVAARERVKLFTWTKITDEILKVYDGVLSSSGALRANDKAVCNQ